MALGDLSGSDPYRAPTGTIGGDEPLPTAFSGYAGLLPRAAALAIDYGVLLVVGAAVGFLIRRLGNAGGLDPSIQDALASLVVFGVIALYFATLESSTSQGTLGKMAMGLQVTDRAGHPIGFARALGRFFAKFVSLVPFLIGFLMAGFTQRKQALHDLLAGTLVLRVR